MEFATPTHYLVLEKQRRELQGAHLSTQQPLQGADAVTLTGTRGEIAHQMFGGVSSGDGANVNPPSRALGETE